MSWLHVLMSSSPAFCFFLLSCLHIMSFRAVRLQCSSYVLLPSSHAISSCHVFQPCSTLWFFHHDPLSCSPPILSAKPFCHVLLPYFLPFPTRFFFHCFLCRHLFTSLPLYLFIVQLPFSNLHPYLLLMLLIKFTNYFYPVLYVEEI